MQSTHTLDICYMFHILSVCVEICYTHNRLSVGLIFIISWKLDLNLVSKHFISFLAEATDYSLKYYQKSDWLLVYCSLCPVALGFKARYEPARDVGI